MKRNKFFSYFYPNRESLEERYKRERLEALPEIIDFQKEETKSVSVKSSTTNQKFLKQMWQSMKMTKELWDRHQQPVTKFSYPFIEFLCHDWYEELPDKSDVYAMNELNLPVERLYATLLKYIDGAQVQKLEKYHLEYKEEFEEFLEDRKRYWVESEMEMFRKAIAEIKLELNDIWKQVEKMHEEYKLLKLFKDFETMILKYQEWAPAWFDFKDKYLNRDYVMNRLDKLSDKIL